jgi:hypothetical protein
MEIAMDKKLHLLDSFTSQGSDGSTYKVMGYEHMVRADALNDGQEHWEPTGQTEFRLADGERVDAADDGSMLIAKTGVKLQVPGDASPGVVRAARAATRAGS